MIPIATVLLALGLGIVTLWLALLAKRAVPEISAGDRAIWFHLAAELSLAVALIAGGTSLLLQDQSWARLLSAGASGGLLYSAINSAGYYAQKRQRPMVVGFGVVATIALSSLAALIFL